MRMAFLAILLMFSLSSFAAEGEKYWIFFEDKGPALNKADWQAVEDQLSERALWRRAKVIKSGPLVNLTDVPVYQPYIETLAQFDVEPVVVSKWLNAISAHISVEKLADIQELSFVQRLQPVARAKRRPVPEPEVLPKPSVPARPFALDYGASITQNEQIKVPELHSIGITGEDVLIGVFDTGFTLEHEALESINIVASYDFINDDDIVDNEEGEPLSQNSHGTKVLSILAGFFEGELIGPAFNSDFLLAKTEDVSSETQVEEDYWIAAAEWAEQLGADIISSSLGYIDWYEYEDMNGRTAPITLAADLAMDKGVVVITSAGNEGNDRWFYITAPADGFDVIAVGAVSPTGTIAGFSSRGHTVDGRIKPEVVAMGVLNRFANPSG